jgi:hypothetical protein
MIVRRVLLVLSVAAGLCGAVRDAHAQGPGHLTLGVSLPHAIAPPALGVGRPFVELHAELRGFSRMALSIFGGLGSVRVARPEGQTSVALWDLGGTARWYLLRTFEGPHVGLEVSFLDTRADGRVDEARVTGRGAGLALGPFLGYKWRPWAGVTLDGWVGPSLMRVRSRFAEDVTQESRDLLEVRWGVLTHLVLGWTL